MRRVGTTDISKFMTPYKYGLQPGFGSDDPAASSTPGALPNWFPTVGLPTVTVQPAPAPAPAPVSDSTKTILYVGVAAAVLGGLYMYSRRPGSFVANARGTWRDRRAAKVGAKKWFWLWIEDSFRDPDGIIDLPLLYEGWEGDLREFAMEQPEKAAEVRASLLKYGAKKKGLPRGNPVRALVRALGG